MKNIFTLILFATVVACGIAKAQTNTFPSTGAAGIGTLSPNASSLLEIKSTTKGVLISRMTKAQRDAIASPATGLLIFQTNSTPGFYYYTGSAWKAVTPAAGTSNGWLLTGNTGTDSSLNFIGTRDAHPLVFRVNNVKAGYIDYSIARANTSFGYQALNGNTTGAYNTANGYDALSVNTTGSNNTAGGYNALGSNSTGYNNTAFGSFALPYNTTGIDNTSIGNGALQSNSTGNDNTATGYFTLYTNTTGSQNSAYGEAALNRNTKGSYNTANGFATLYLNTTGYSNVAAGAAALYSNTTRSNLVAVGDSALYNNGKGAVNSFDASYNTAVGSKALFANTTGYSNTAVGYYALDSNKTGVQNTGIGTGALQNNKTGNNNTAIAPYALYKNTAGGNNTAVGEQSLSTNTTGSSNTAVGYFSLGFNLTGSNNTANGVKALYSNTTGNDNTAGGFQSLYSNTTGFYNTASGEYALSNNTTGAYNTGIGLLADVNSGGYNYSTALGVGATITASNQVRIGSVGSAAGYDPVSIGGVVGWSTLSDGRAKKNIKQNVPGLAFINKLNPVTYNLDLAAADKVIQHPLIKDKDGKTIQPSADEISARKAKEAIVYTGFVAQDVEKAAKGLKYDFSGVDAAKNDKDLYGLRYGEFVVPLVKAVQELSRMNDDKDARIDNLQKQIDALKAMIVSNQSTINSQQSTVISSASLQQNIPNPFTNSTTINYTLPQKFTSAQILITDKSGKALKAVTVSGSGKGSLNVNASTLAGGAYQYSLTIDGRLIDTKQMMIAK